MSISINNVVFAYPNGVRALDGISLSILPGERVAIIGQNGSGKTTLAKHLNGLLRPTAGSVTVDGWNTREHTVAQLARRVGFVFQNPTEQIFKSRVADEVAFGPRNLKLEPAVVAERVQSALEQTGLAGVHDRHPYDLLMAQRKWVAIASVLVMEPAIYVLDEPTLGQDTHGLARLGDLIASLGRQGKTVIMISHDIDFCAEHFARIIVMGQGQVLADGDRRSVFARQDLLAQAYLEAPQMTRLGVALNLAQTVTTVPEFLEAISHLSNRSQNVRNDESHTGFKGI